MTLYGQSVRCTSFPIGLSFIILSITWIIGGEIIYMVFDIFPLAFLVLGSGLIMSWQGWIFKDE